MEVSYSASAIEDLKYWKQSGNKKIMERITALIHSIEATPFQGIGKPEALKHNLKGFWSRRINGEHRIVYRLVNPEEVEVISLRFHYK
jgi:toxin YoeB